MSEANVGTVIPGEEEGGSQSPDLQSQQEDAVKEQARAKGWRPLKEWDGDPAEWVSAKEFMGREKLYAKIHDLKNALTRQSSKAESDIAQIRRHLEQVREVEYKKALDEVRKERREAIAAGDAATAEALDQRIDEIQEERATAKAEAAKQPQAVQQGPTQEFVEWKNANPWFDSDADLTQVAIEIGMSHAQANPNKSQKEVLEYVTRRVKQMNPEKFGKRPTANAVDEGGSVAIRQSGKKGPKVSVGEMSEDERKVYDMYIKRRVFSTQAEKNKRSLQEETLAQMAAVRGQ